VSAVRVRPPLPFKARWPDKLAGFPLAKAG